MASTVIRRGKLLVDIFYPQKLKRSFQTHRDIKSCISLRWASTLFKKNPNLFLQTQKTAFLQFLNNYPLSYNYKIFLNESRLYFQILEMKDLSMYEQHLKLSILVKLKDYLSKEDKHFWQQEINKQQRWMIKRVKDQPFDTVHAMNYLVMHKDSTSNQLYLHALQALKQSEYSIMQAVMPKIAPFIVKSNLQIIKGLTVNQWNVLRRFGYFLDFVAYEWSLQEWQIGTFIETYGMVTQMQLHLVGYRMIPPIISFILGQISKNIKGQNTHDTATIQKIFESFRYLPLAYEQTPFKTIKLQLLKRIKSGRETLFCDKLPFNRLKQPQIQQFLQAGLKGNILNSLLFVGNDVNVRYWLKKSKIMEILYEEYCGIRGANSKQFSIMLTTGSLLIQFYQKDKIKLNNIVEGLKKVGNQVMVQDSNKISKILPFASLLHLINLNSRFQLGWQTNHYLKDYYRRQSQFNSLIFMQNILKGIELFSNNQSEPIVNFINLFLTKMVTTATKFHFRFFTAFIILLSKDLTAPKYLKTVELMYNKLQVEDCGYFVEMFNRYPVKSFRMIASVLQNVIAKDKTLKTIGKFCVVDHFGHLQTDNGGLIKQLRNAFNQLEHFLKLQDLKGFLFLEVIKILQFCSYFYNNIKGSAQKMLLLALGYFDTLDMERQGINNVMSFIKAIASIAFKEHNKDFYIDKITKLFDKIRITFPKSKLLKVKELQIKWFLGSNQDIDRSSLTVSQIMNELEKQRYETNYDVMVILLKLNSFGGVTLTQGGTQRLQMVLRQGLQNGAVRVSDIMKGLRLLTDRYNQVFESKIKGLLNILILCLKRTLVSQSFSFYEPFLEIAKLSRSGQLLQVVLQHIEHIQSRWQITKILNIIKYFPNITLDSITGRLLTSVNKNINGLQPNLIDFLYILHCFKHSFKDKQWNLLNEIHKKAQIYVITLISGSNTDRKKIKVQMMDNWNLSQVLKMLWIAIKTDTVTSTTIELYQYLVQNSERLKELPVKKSFQGILWEYIYYVCMTFGKKLSNQVKIKHINPKIFKFSYNLNNNMELINEEHKTQLLESLKSQGLKQIKKGQFQVDSSNIFVLGHKVNNITLPIWIKANGRQHGVFVTDDFYLNSSKQLKGRATFIAKALQSLTGIKIITYVPGQPFTLQKGQ